MLCSQKRNTHENKEGSGGAVMLLPSRAERPLPGEPLPSSGTRWGRPGIGGCSGTGSVEQGSRDLLQPRGLGRNKAHGVSPSPAALVVPCSPSQAGATRITEPVFTPCPPAPQWLLCSEREFYKTAFFNTFCLASHMQELAVATGLFIFVWVE